MTIFYEFLKEQANNFGVAILRRVAGSADLDLTPTTIEEHTNCDNDIGIRIEGPHGESIFLSVHVSGSANEFVLDFGISSLESEGRYHKVSIDNCGNLDEEECYRLVLDAGNGALARLKR